MRWNVGAEITAHALDVVCLLALRLLNYFA